MSEERIIPILVDMQAKITELYNTSVRREEFNDFKDWVYRAFDQQTIFLKRLDENSVIMKEDIRLTQEDVSQVKVIVTTHQQEIDRLSASSM